MEKSEFDVVTGAFGYSGKYIAERLQAQGRRVRTLTNTLPMNSSAAEKIEAYPLCFSDPDQLIESLRGASTLYNTYWVRFNHRRFSHGEAVRNTKILFEAAKRAGVRRIVHISITNPQGDASLEYFRGKAELEQALIESGISYAILRPTVLFGEEDILINNIAWMLRRFPFFALFGRGQYKLQPIHVADLADLAVRQGARRENCIIEAIGPETFTYRGLVEAIAHVIGVRRPIFPMLPLLVWLVGWIIGKCMRDVTITRAEVSGLMQGLLHVEAEPAGTTSLTLWASENASSLGKTYANELRRRNYRATTPFAGKRTTPPRLLRFVIAAIKHCHILQRMVIIATARRFGIGQGRAVFQELARRSLEQLSVKTMAAFLYVTVFKRRKPGKMPRTLFISITNRCNLQCKQCYAAGWDRKSHLTKTDIKRIITDSKQNGTDIYTILGGEPFTRRKMLYELLDAHPDCLFLINSNGTLISEKVADEVARFGNAVVHLSLEGDQSLTDERRGKGVYVKVLKAMDRLKTRGVLFDTTIMVTKQNQEAITDTAFLRQLIEHGAMAVWYTCYRPVGDDYDSSLIMSYADRVTFFKKVVALRNELPLMLVDNQFDYSCFGGCFATLGLNTHINSYGCVEPCPAMHYSTDNVITDKRPISEIWSESALLRKVRAMQDQRMVRCPITDAPQELLAALRKVKALDSTGGQDYGALERLEGCHAGEELLAAEPPDMYHGMKTIFLTHLFGRNGHRGTPALGTRAVDPPSSVRTAE